MNTEIPETSTLSEEDEIAQILEHLPTETDISVEVPSKGRTYFAKGGTVDLKPIHFEDEKALATGNRGRDFNPANYLLSRCVKNVDVDDLLLIDKIYLLLKIRQISYGNDYTVAVACNECGAENPLNVEIDKLTVKNIPDETDVFNIPVELRQIKKEALVSCPTVAEETYLSGDKVYDNLWRFVKSIGGNTKATVIAKVIKQLPLVDMHLLVNALSLDKYGLQPEIQYTCDSCHALNLINLPIDENFFSVS
tara:strand:- start:5080 stop:5832 length:753 start_codon:yes stop_codon:yes gene_type:complete